MPRGRRRIVPSDDDDDISEDSEPDFSQTQRSRKSQKLSKTQGESSQSANIQEFVTKVVKMLLPYAVSKFAVKRADLTNQAMNGEQKATAQVLTLARIQLNEIYNLDLIELRETKIKQFIVVSKAPAAIFDEYTDDEKPEIILLYLILEYIYMKNGEVPDSTLFEYLGRFEIYLDQEHDFFGDVKHLIHDVYPKQHYLSFVKNIAEASNVEKISVKWGERAEREILKREMLDAVSESLDCEPTAFLQQYEEAYGEDVDAVGEEVENLQMSSQTVPVVKKGRRGRRSAADQMEVDESD